MELRQYSNGHLQEVVCGFNFINSGVVWDSAYLGQYNDKIAPLGFTEREERNGIQINFGDDQSNLSQPIKVSAQKIEAVMLFKNEVAGQAITLGKDQISFHTVSDYKGWETFVSGLIEPGLQSYQELGLLKGSIRNNVVYLNRFEFDADEWLSEYFTFLSPIGTDFGLENSSVIHRILDYNEKLALIVRLHSVLVAKGKKQVTLECGAVTKQFVGAEALSWLELASITHEPIRSFFESLITEKLKDRL